MKWRNNPILWIFPPVQCRIKAIEDRIQNSKDGDWKEFCDAQVNETLVTGVSVGAPKIWLENDVWADSGHAGARPPSSLKLL
jgi:hypothetical protein